MNGSLFTCLIYVSLCGYCFSYIIGCKKQAGGLILKDLLINDRKTIGAINWYAYNDYIKSLLSRCEEIVAENGYKVYGLQFYGECWGTKSLLSAINSELVASNDCINGKFETCKINDVYCIGKQETTYIFEAEKTHNDFETKVSNWNDWETWTQCSSLCGGGTQERYRTCNGNLENCEGESEEIRDCNEEPCKEVCKVTAKTDYSVLEVIGRTVSYAPFCLMFSKNVATNKYQYSILAKIFSPAVSRVGLFFSAEDTDNFQFIYIHISSELLCYSSGSVIQKISITDNSDQCNRAFQSQKWILIEAKIFNSYVEFVCDGRLLIKQPLNPLLGRTGKGGLLVPNDSVLPQIVFYKNLYVV
ncbi:uncharacterized protein LOC105843661 isoform X2 [Hydra vulgaris]|uniref:Uncharacterized protein LOC105843661 isoform X2 n=1 Tax=Hydra vulgaris TaxID=6087 RepID=A0ABM4D3P7_HYDVU